MVNHTDRDSTRDTHARRESNNFPANTFASAKFGNRETPALDDVIVSLANSRENCRARQVTEWEQMRKHLFRSAI